MNRSHQVLICFLFIMNVVFSQEDYMSKIVDESCICVNELSEDISGQKLEMQLGLCIIAAAGPYQKEILEDYGYDLDDVGVDGEQIGLLIGGKMAAKCPEAIVAITDRMSDDVMNETVETIEMIGKVQAVAKDFLIHFSIKNEEGRTQKFYWYSFIKTDSDLIRDYGNLEGKNVSLKYHKEEFFDPKIMEYRTLNIIDVLNIN